MSSPLPYRALRISDGEVVLTVSANSGLTLCLRQEPVRDRCSACQSANVIHHGVQERNIRALPVSGKPVDLLLPVPLPWLPRLRTRPSGGLPVRLPFRPAEAETTQTYRN
ncbi:transposase family protein [Zavarzinella formosa]|uniref:transposase family protein n=1 Tax=Zavarzinella formosa TaxID=360055 RepID=UPI000A06AA27